MVRVRARVRVRRGVGRRGRHQEECEAAAQPHVMRREGGALEQPYRAEIGEIGQRYRGPGERYRRYFILLLLFRFDPQSVSSPRVWNTRTFLILLGRRVASHVLKCITKC